MHSDVAGRRAVVLLVSLPVVSPEPVHGVLKMPNPKVDSIAGWSNLSALGCLIALVLWFATTGLPEIMDKWERQSQSTRADFKEVVGDMITESKEQRQDFRDELKQHRELTGKMSVSGHEAVNGLSRQIADLKRVVEERVAQAAVE